MVGVLALASLAQREEVCATMHLLQQAEVALHVVVELRQVLGVHVEAASTRLRVILEAAGRHLLQVLARELRVLPDHAEEVVGVPGAEEGKVALADGDVIRRRVGVQLLMPLLNELALDAGAVTLLDAVIPHDVQDAVTDRVAPAGAPARAGSDAQAQQRPDRRVGRGLHRRGHDAAERLLGMRHVLRLVAAVPVPLQRLLLRQAQVGGQPRRLDL
mmetsp:Transcript_71135/g.183412  ORF Transcript_71135/g.183412 Transcript_71135/m.183412 type:complete len:216 (-) Transcript_71135:245-892(-)